MVKGISFLLSLTAAFSLGAATVVTAQKYSDSTQREEKHRADLSAADDMEVIVSVAEYQPGEMIRRHFHHGLEAAYVINGAEVTAPGKGAFTLPTGKTVLNLREAVHGGLTVSGDNSLSLFTVHIVDKKAPLYDYVD
ncbi:MAG: hypothetical protein VW274_10970 [Thalassolituus sp.]